MKVRCIICSEVDKWENVDRFRMKQFKDNEKKQPINMSMCTNCGFVTYPDIVADKKKLEDFYVDDYRNAPAWGNLVTGNNKLWYHAEFLKEVIAMWGADKKKPQVFEIGAAMGMFLEWFGKQFPEGTMRGCELTKSFVRVAKHNYNINLESKFDDTKKYDMIATYKVAEHMIDADEEIAKYAKCLTEDGYLYIGVPIWFEKATNFGTGGFDLEYYYHLNHINVWTRNQFEHLLERAGLQIVKENHTFYDSVYLCKVGEVKKSDYKNDIDKQKKEMEAIKEAYALVMQNKYKEALETYTRYPLAWLGYYEMNRAQFDKEGLEFVNEQVIKPMLKALPTDHTTLSLAADIYLRYQQFEPALAMFDKFLQHAPNSGHGLRMIGVCFREMANKETRPSEKIALWRRAADVELKRTMTCPADKADAITWLFYAYSQIPVSEEKITDK